MASPIKFAHVVLKTSRYDEMVAWWKDFLGAEARHENGFITFLSYDEEHHRMAIANIPNLEDQNRVASGVEHFAFTYESLDALFEQFEHMKNKGQSPYWTINHGMTLSAYYRDPDGNQVETQFDSMSLEVADEQHSEVDTWWNTRPSLFLVVRQANGFDPSIEACFSKQAVELGIEHMPIRRR